MTAAVEELPDAVAVMDPFHVVRLAGDPLTDKQHARLENLFAVDEHAELEVTRRIYQRMVEAYRHPD